MAKVIITIEDEDDDGLSVRLDFVPPLEELDGNAPATNAQAAAAVVLEAINAACDSPDYDDRDY